MNRPSDGKSALQFAALPWREGERGLELLLVTSRETKRWVIPKGWPHKDRAPHVSAAREAREEAGIEGKIDPAGVGLFHYIKRLKRGEDLPCRVEVFALKVLKQRKNWPEKGQREARWMTPEEAAEAVQEPELKSLIQQFGKDYLTEV